MKLEFEYTDFMEEKSGKCSLCDSCGADAVEIANAKLEKYIKEHGKVVYAYHDEYPFGWFETKLKEKHKNFQAILINIEAIKKCEHPKEKITCAFSPLKSDHQHNHCYIFKCECGAKVEPTSFRSVE